MTTTEKLRQEEVPLSMKSCWLVLFPPVQSNLEEMESSSSPLPPLLPYFFFALDCQFIMVRRCTSIRVWDPQRKSLIDKISYQNQSSPKRENPVDNAPVEVLCFVFIQYLDCNVTASTSFFIWHLENIIKHSISSFVIYLVTLFALKEVRLFLQGRFTKQQLFLHFLFQSGFCPAM